MARPSDFSQEVVTLICERMQEGETLSQICRDPELPDRRTVYRWLDAHEPFRLAYARARIALMEFYSDQIIDVSWDSSNDTIEGEGNTPDKCNHEWIARSRLKVDTMKFLMSKINPRQYGERLAVSPVEGAIEPVQQLQRIELVAYQPEEGHLEKRIKELEELLGMREREELPRQITYDPGPLPSRTEAQIVYGIAQAIKRNVPKADQRPPEEVISEVMEEFERVLQAKYAEKALDG